MKEQVRRNVFETNSSSTHSITFFMKEEYDKWRSGGMYIFKGSGYGWRLCFEVPECGKMYTRDQVIGFLRGLRQWDESYLDDDDVLDKMIRNEEFYDCEAFDDSDLEWESESFTTPSGEQVVAVCQYG